MIQKTFFFIIFNIVVLSSFGQSNLVKGGQYVAIKYGMSPESKTTKGVPTLWQIETGKAIREKLIFRYGLLYEQGYIGSTDFFIPSIYSDFMSTPLHINNVVFFNVSLGVHTGLEYLFLNNKFAGRDSYNGVLFGGRAGVEIDYGISRLVSLKAELLEYYNPLSKLGQWHYTLTMGVSLNINGVQRLYNLKTKK